MFLGFGVPHLRFFICWVETPKRHTFGLYVSTSIIELFPVGCVQDIGKTAILALAPPTFGTSSIFHDSRVRYPNIYGFSIEIMEIRCIGL